MSDLNKFNSTGNSLNSSLETLLAEGRNEMLERKHSILLSIDTQAIEAKKDVRHHINKLVKVQSALLNNKTKH